MRAVPWAVWRRWSQWWCPEESFNTAPCSLSAPSSCPSTANPCSWALMVVCGSEQQCHWLSPSMRSPAVQALRGALEQNAVILMTAFFKGTVGLGSSLTGSSAADEEYPCSSRQEPIPASYAWHLMWRLTMKGHQNTDWYFWPLW